MESGELAGWRRTEETAHPTFLGRLPAATTGVRGLKWGSDGKIGFGSKGGKR
jgi:hypothetical protein